MGIADCFEKEDRVPVKFSDFARLMKESVKGEILMNGINCNVPHRYMREMATGISEEPAPIAQSDKNEDRKSKGRQKVEKNKAIHP